MTSENHLLSAVSVSYVSFLTSPVSISCLLSHNVSCLTTSPVSHLLSHVSCLMSPVSCLSHVSCLSSIVYLTSYVSCLSHVFSLPHVSCLSHVYCLTSPSHQGLGLACGCVSGDKTKNSTDLIYTIEANKQTQAFGCLSRLSRLNPIVSLTDVKFSGPTLQHVSIYLAVLNLSQLLAISVFHPLHLQLAVPNYDYAARKLATWTPTANVEGFSTQTLKEQSGEKSIWVCLQCIPNGNNLKI